MSRKIYDRYRFSESRLRNILQFGINCSLKDVDRGIYHQMGFYFSKGTKLIFVLLDAHNYNLYFILDFEGNFPEALVNQLKTPDKVCFVVARHILRRKSPGLFSLDLYSKTSIYFTCLNHYANKFLKQNNTRLSRNYVII